MFAVIGILVVIGAVVGGYLMEHGHIRVLMQPAELLIIGGAAVGTLLIGNSPRILKRSVQSFSGIIAGSKFNRARYVDSIRRSATHISPRTPAIGGSRLSSATSQRKTLERTMSTTRHQLTMAFLPMVY